MLCKVAALPFQAHANFWTFQAHSLKPDFDKYYMNAYRKIEKNLKGHRRSFLCFKTSKSN